MADLPQQIMDDIWTTSSTPPDESPQSARVSDTVTYKGQSCTIVSVDTSGPNPITIELPNQTTVRVARSGQYFDDGDQTIKNIGD